jgi:hypothetical protein
MQRKELFHIITYGRGNMPAHAGQVSAEDRWRAMVHIRRLQDQAAKSPPQ